LREHKDYVPAKTPLKDRIRFTLVNYISNCIPPRGKWTYITLGGPQLIDIRRLLDALDPPQYPAQIISCYHNPEDDEGIATENIRTAEGNANNIHMHYNLSYTPNIVPGTVKEIRSSDVKSGRIVMWLDYEGTVLKFRDEISACVKNRILHVGDLLFVTSCADEKFLSNPRHHFRIKANQRVASFLRKDPDEVTTADILTYHDFNLIRDEVKSSSFTHKKRLDCVPLGPLVVYEDTVRMLWLPLRIVGYDCLMRPPSIKLRYLVRWSS